MGSKGNCARSGCMSWDMCTSFLDSIPFFDTPPLTRNCSVFHHCSESSPGAKAFRVISATPQVLDGPRLGHLRPRPARRAGAWDRFHRQMRNHRATERSCWRRQAAAPRGGQQEHKETHDETHGDTETQRHRREETHVTNHQTRRDYLAGETENRKW